MHTSCMQSMQAVNKINVGLYARILHKYISMCAGTLFVTATYVRSSIPSNKLHTSFAHFFKAATPLLKSLILGPEVTVLTNFHTAN